MSRLARSARALRRGRRRGRRDRGGRCRDRDRHRKWSIPLRPHHGRTGRRDRVDRPTAGIECRRRRERPVDDDLPADDGPAGADAAGAVPAPTRASESPARSGHGARDPARRKAVPTDRTAPKRAGTGRATRRKAAPDGHNVDPVRIAAHAVDTRVVAESAAAVVRGMVYIDRLVRGVLAHSLGRAGIMRVGGRGEHPIDRQRGRSRRQGQQDRYGRQVFHHFGVRRLVAAFFL